MGFCEETHISISTSSPPNMDLRSLLEFDMSAPYQFQNHQYHQNHYLQNQNQALEWTAYTGNAEQVLLQEEAPILDTSSSQLCNLGNLNYAMAPVHQHQEPDMMTMTTMMNASIFPTSANQQYSFYNNSTNTPVTAAGANHYHYRQHQHQGYYNAMGLVEEELEPQLQIPALDDDDYLEFFNFNASPQVGGGGGGGGEAVDGCLLDDPILLLENSSSSSNSNKNNPSGEIQLGGGNGSIGSSASASEYGFNNKPNRLSKSSMIGFEDISKYFYMTITDAAKMMNVGLTVLKKRCRELGISRWPHRKMKSMKSLIHNVQELGKEAPAEDIRREIQTLEEHKRLMEQKPEIQMTERTKKLRQACFKANYKKRRARQVSPYMVSSNIFRY